ncbi:AraC family transcriptional regulator [Leifsonia poae]|uniref:AraC family transcriptional regulator n=1 Tax=Leifsonia poae TaxID=110933 RepID=UPI001CBE570A|nr:helix-turn-helix transcriptional regulator [Leifsonia poae]
MSTTGQTAIVLETFPLAEGEAFDHHVHRDFDQLAWVREGVLMVTIGRRNWVLPPSLALWIPAGVWHTTEAVRPGTMQGIYLEPRRDGRLAGPTVVSVSPLLRELIDYLCTDLADPERRRAEVLVPDLLHPVGTLTIDLPMPADSRALGVADALVADPSDPRDLAAWGREVGASTRTLSRLFATQTGMSFSRWRTIARLRAALAALSEGDTVSRAAARVGYSSASAFIASFRAITGQTPGGYFAQLDPTDLSA